MSAKKRTNPLVRTDATKAKLPLPKRYRLVTLTCSGCKGMFRVRGVIGKMNVHDCACGHSDQYIPTRNVKAASRPLPDLSIVGLEPAPDFRVVPVPSITNAEYLRDGKPGTGAQVPCMDWPADSLPSGDLSYIPVTAAPYPWPVRVLNWLDNTQYWTRQRVANALRRLAARVAP